MPEVGLYLSTYLFGPADPSVCARCTALVWDRDIHNQWHTENDAAA